MEKTKKIKDFYPSRPKQEPQTLEHRKEPFTSLESFSRIPYVATPLEKLEAGERYEFDEKTLATSVKEKLREEFDMYVRRRKKDGYWHEDVVGTNFLFTNEYRRSDNGTQFVVAEGTELNQKTVQVFLNSLKDFADKVVVAARLSQEPETEKDLALYLTHGFATLRLFGISNHLPFETYANFFLETSAALDLPSFALQDFGQSLVMVGREGKKIGMTDPEKITSSLKRFWSVINTQTTRLRFLTTLINFCSSGIATNDVLSSIEIFSVWCKQQENHSALLSLYLNIIEYYSQNQMLGLQTRVFSRAYFSPTIGDIQNAQLLHSRVNRVDSPFVVDWWKQHEQEDRLLSRAIEPEAGSVLGSTFGWVAKDAVGSFSDFGTLTSITTLDQKPTQASDIRSIDDLYWRKNLSSEHNIPMSDFLVFTRDVFANMGPEQEGECVEQCSQGTISAEQWRKFVQLREEITDNKDLDNTGDWEKELYDLFLVKRDAQRDLEAGTLTKEDLWETKRLIRDLTENLPMPYLFSPQYTDVCIEYQELAERIWPALDSKQFRQHFIQFLEKKRAQVKLTPVHFDSLETALLTSGFTQKTINIVKSTHLFSQLHHPDIRSYLEKTLSLSFTDLTLREQTQFLTFLATAEPALCDRTFAVIRKFGVPAARAFLSCEYGKHLGEAVIKIGETYPAEEAKKIFEAYATLIDSIEVSTEELAASFFKTDKRTFDRDKVNNELLLRGKNSLASFAEKRVPSEDIPPTLERINRDTALFSAMFKTVSKERGSMDFSEIQGMSLESIDARDLSSKQKQEMLKIAYIGWLPRGAERAKSIQKELQAKFEDPEVDTLFYVLQQKEKMMGFVAFSTNHPDAPDGIYGDSFNILPEFTSAGIGLALITQTMNTEAKKGVVYGYTDATSPIETPVHMKLFGTIIGAETQSFADGETKTWLKLRRDDAQNPHYREQQAEAKERVVPCQAQIIKQTIDQMVQQGHVVTGYVFEGKSVRIFSQPKI